MTDLRIDPSSALAELAKREHDKFKHYFANCRPGCLVDFTTFVDQQCVLNAHVV